MVRALAGSAKTLLNAGREQEAANYFLRAGRSVAQRQAPETTQWLESAAAHAGSDHELKLEAFELLKHIR